MNKMTCCKCGCRGRIHNTTSSLKLRPNRLECYITLDNIMLSEVRLLVFKQKIKKLGQLTMSHLQEKVFYIYRIGLPEDGTVF